MRIPRGPGHAPHGPGGSPEAPGKAPRDAIKETVLLKTPKKLISEVSGLGHIVQDLTNLHLRDDFCEQRASP